MLAVVAMAAVGCADDGAHPPEDTGGSTGSAGQRDESAAAGTSGGTGGGGGARFVTAALAPFDDCSAFLDHVKGEASERVGPYGLDQNGWWYLEDGDMAIDRAATTELAAQEMSAAEAVDDAADEPASAPGGDPVADSADGDSAGAGYTSTNVQEAGVDEPDIIKTDGDRILVVRDNRLIHVDIADGNPRITDEITIPEGWGHELFFLGDRAVLFTNGGTFHPGPVPIDTPDADAQFTDSSIPDNGLGWTAPAAIVVEVDLADPADLEIDATLKVEGQYLSARRVGDNVRLAVSTGPQQLPWVFPQSPAGEERAEATNREMIDESSLADWVPDYQLTTGESATAGQLVDCANLNRPADFSGFDVVSVIDIDLSSGIGTGFDPADATGVLAGGQTVYSSLDRFYVATTKWVHQDELSDGIVPREWSEEYETELHAFAIAPGEPARYTASGSVAGSLLNQFSLDEHDGYLRVVTTDGSPWDAGDLSESGLTVLAEDGDRLVQVGHVGGLGRGERLYSARLLDDVGFAVTFRQIDPFYVLDLSDPTNPKVTGELKIPGFSTYLHPIDDDHVLGIGQAATEDGRVQGLKVSMFDVSDPAEPRETAVWTMPGANSPAEYDHRAFQMWDRTAILPVESWQDGFHGVVLLDTAHSSGDGIVEVARISQSPLDAAPTSDCRPITTDDGLPEDSELFWMAQDGSSHLQLCTPDDRGGWGSHWCEQVPFEDAIHWGTDPQILEDALIAIGARAGDRIEMCWPEGDVATRVERTLVADGVLYTLTRQAIQANELGTYDLVTALALR